MAYSDQFDFNTQQIRNRSNDMGDVHANIRAMLDDFDNYNENVLKNMWTTAGGQKARERLTQFTSDIRRIYLDKFVQTNQTNFSDAADVTAKINEV